MKYHSCVVLLFISMFSNTINAYQQENINNRGRNVPKFQNITFEMSLKPFKKNEKKYIEDVCHTVFSQWKSLINHTDTISILLWVADGSEILDYSGNQNQKLEWAMYIGNPNTQHEVNSSPKTLSLHERAYTYIDNPPSFSYADLKYIISQLKLTGKQISGKEIRIGATFDPGPEFSKSSFKYSKHPEICMGNTMGSKSFVCCYSTLNADKDTYAGYPEGIPQDTPFGTFFGKQCQAFLTDLDFDYLWLSNGFGFGMETWNATGATFDGKSFNGDKMDAIRNNIIQFWESFRAGCPDFRVETRGTNMSTGIDLASDGVDLRKIYKGGFNLLPPPNSPWASIDGDFGLELTGYMSRLAELPDNRFLFRFYTHDPWWANSPWLDRYGREPHDIYLPMAVSRVNSEGGLESPTHLSFLSIDDSYGNMPDQVPDEVIPHVLQARRLSPDQMGLLVWVYPFDEYHDWAQEKPEHLSEIYYGDWFIRQALNDGFPMNTVVSTKNFVSLYEEGYVGFNASILVSIVPDAGSKLEAMLTQFIKNGGKAIIYGPASRASKDFLNLLNIKLKEELTGEFRLITPYAFDVTRSGYPNKIYHRKIMSGGGIQTVISNQIDAGLKDFIRIGQGDMMRDILVLQQQEEWNGGAVCYIRGTNSATFRGGRLLTADNPMDWFIGGELMRFGLNLLGYTIKYEKPNLSMRNPVNVISRNDNGYFFSGYVPNQIVEQSFRFPIGAPLFIGMETELKNGFTSYRLPKAWNKECRIFIQQKEGFLTCKELAPVEINIKKKIIVTGLQEATVRVFPGKDETYFKAMTDNNQHTARPDTLHVVKQAGGYYEYENINGQLVFTW